MYKKLILVLIGLILILGGGTVGAQEKTVTSQSKEIKNPILTQAVAKKGINDEYVLIMSKNNDLCSYMMKLFNDDLKKHGQVKYKKHKEFNWIKWKKKEIILRPPGYPEQCENCIMDIAAKIALFDINNDSKDEAIIYHEGSLSNYPIDVYDIFTTDNLKMFDSVVDGKQYYSKTLISFDTNDGIPQNVYDISDAGLRMVPEQMRFYVDATKARGDKNIHFVSSPTKINFIKFSARFYIAFEGPMSLASGESRDKSGNYSVISELQPDNSLNNQCLYLIKKDDLINRRTK